MKCYLWNMTTNYRWASILSNKEDLMKFYNMTLEDCQYDMILENWFFYLKNEKDEIVQATWY